MIGMIHLMPLVGYAKHPGIEKVLKHALHDLSVLERAHFNGALVENEFDHPHQVKGGPEIIASMTHILTEIVKKSHIPIGVEVLLNDPQASLAIAHVGGAQFIRTDYFVDRMARDEYGGLMEINAKKLISYRHTIKADNIFVLTDLQVKYATLLEKGKTIGESAKQAIEAGSDGLIITGKVSGKAPKVSDLIEAKKVAATIVPVFVGSGYCVNNAGKLLKHADGAIVGTAIKTQGYVGEKKAKQLITETHTE